MSIGPLDLHWLTTTEGWALLVSLVALAGSALTFFLAELRQWERISIRVSFRYRVSYERDRYLYPTVVQRHNLRTGDRCCLLTVKYHGRHSVALKAAYFEIACDGLSPFDPDMAYGQLHDGQSKRVLLVPHAFDFEDVTGFAIETKSHGVRFKPVRRFLRFQLRNVSARPRLFRWLRAVTGVPHLPRADDMKPRSCRHCTAGRRHIETIEDQLVPWIRRSIFTAGGVGSSAGSAPASGPPAQPDWSALGLSTCRNKRPKRFVMPAPPLPSRPLPRPLPVCREHRSR